MSNIKNVKQEDMKEKGRLQFFYHLPSSKLPIRDVLDEQRKGHKTEPHIEIGAENYWKKCYQRNVHSFAKKDEKYLFLFTNCKNKELSEWYNQKFIVGYIIKEKIGEAPKHQKSSCQKTKSETKTFIKGKTVLFNFQDALSFKKLGFSKFVRVKKINEETTKVILNHFKGKDEITEKCIEEIKEKDKENKTCYKRRYSFPCKYENECLR
ncbi:MAG: hypothetical protein HZR80_05030 [Candidatus Heimdallarchaeota archaeon]